MINISFGGVTLHFTIYTFHIMKTLNYLKRLINLDTFMKVSKVCVFPSFCMFVAPNLIDRTKDFQIIRSFVKKDAIKMNFKFRN